MKFNSRLEKYTEARRRLSWSLQVGILVLIGSLALVSFALDGAPAAYQLFYRISLGAYCVLLGVLVVLRWYVGRVVRLLSGPTRVGA